MTDDDWEVMEAQFATKHMRQTGESLADQLDAAEMNRKVFDEMRKVDAEAVEAERDRILRHIEERVKALDASEYPPASYRTLTIELRELHRWIREG